MSDASPYDGEDELMGRLAVLLDRATRDLLMEDFAPVMEQFENLVGRAERIRALRAAKGRTGPGHRTVETLVWIAQDAARLAEYLAAVDEVAALERIGRAVHRVAVLAGVGDGA